MASEFTALAQRRAVINWLIEHLSVEQFTTVAVGVILHDYVNIASKYVCAP